jgi:hypothetical protein
MDLNLRRIRFEVERRVVRIGMDALGKQKFFQDGTWEHLCPVKERFDPTHAVTPNLHCVGAGNCEGLRKKKKVWDLETMRIHLLSQLIDNESNIPHTDYAFASHKA